MQIAPLSLVKAGDATTFTFNPRGSDGNGNQQFVKSTGVPIADKRISVTRSRVAASGREKVNFKITNPVVSEPTINGIVTPTVVRTAYVDVSFTFDKASTLEERLQCRYLVHSLMADALGVAVIDDLDYLY